MAEFPQCVDVGRVRGFNLFYRLGFVLVDWFGSGSGDIARPGYHQDQKVSLRNFRSWLARLKPQLAALRDGVSVAGRSFYATGPFGAQRRILRLRLDGYPDVAH